MHEFICHCKNYVDKNLPEFYKLTCLVPNPFPIDYQPQLVVLPELLPQHASYQQSLMGIFRWMIDLGRSDILAEVPLLISQMVLSCQRHLETALHVMFLLIMYNNSSLCMDPTCPDLDRTQFLVCDWSEFYGEAEEPILPYAPDAMVKVKDLHMFVDSYHAGYIIHIDLVLVSRYILIMHLSVCTQRNSLFGIMHIWCSI